MNRSLPQSANAPAPDAETSWSWASNAAAAAGTSTDLTTAPPAVASDWVNWSAPSRPLSLSSWMMATRLLVCTM